MTGSPDSLLPNSAASSQVERHSAERDELRARRLPRAFDIGRAARDVIVIAMSARSGSSWLVELLKQSAGAIHLRGEATTLLRLHGFSWPYTGGSEALDARAAHLLPEHFSHDLSLEAGWPAAGVADPESFCVEVAWRLRLQWPDSDFPANTLDLIRAEIGRAGGTGGFDATAFTRSLLARLRDAGVPVDPGYYDIDAAPAPTAALPWTRLLESPPFMLFAPWKPAAPADFHGRPLIIKSAGDVYRLGFYRALFPNARFRIIHLRRNPAASVNGLIDGWQSARYQSFRVGGLAIAGYSDRGEVWRRDWWKFDLPPGWEDFRNASLLDVCAWQWSSAQQAVLEWIRQSGCEYSIVRYEDLIASAEQRRRTIADLCDWIGLGEREFAETRIVNASNPPRPYRWKKREAEILDAVSGETCRRVIGGLGYAMNPEAWP